MSAADEDQYRDLPATPLEEVAAALGAAGLAAYRNTLVGHATPMVTAYFERVTNPQPGDLVVEASSFDFRARRGEALRCVGRLVKVQPETQVVDSDGNDLDEEDYFTRDVWYIQPLDGGIITWEDCSFVAIPASPDQAHEWGEVRETPRSA